MERKAREAELLVNRYYLHHGGGEARHGEEGQGGRAPSQQVLHLSFSLVGRYGIPLLLGYVVIGRAPL
jgi:hypothetical protein